MISILKEWSAFIVPRILFTFRASSLLGREGSGSQWLDPIEKV
jgi:hypothetical protein